MIFPLINNILILLYAWKAIEIIDFFFKEILKEQYIICGLDALSKIIVHKNKSHFLLQ